jgi:hypothetical protein
MHQQRSLPLLKKYWAILRDVVANCKTPWSSPDEASDALKLALGITEAGKTVKGDWFIRAGSISFNSLDQAAFRDFFDKAMALLGEVTGVDPDELSDRFRHFAETEPSHETPASDAVGEPVADKGGGEKSPSGSAPAPTGDEPGSEGNEARMKAAHGEQSASSPELNQVERDWLRQSTKMLWAATGKGEQDVLTQQMQAVLG